MFWFIGLFAIVVISAGASLVASRDSRRNIASGNPTFASVADVTGIWNRERLDELIGPRDDDGRYNVGAETVAQLPRTRWKRWFDSDLGDVGCILLAVASAVLLTLSYSVAAWCVLSAAAIYIVAGYAGGTVMYMRSRS